MKITIRHPSSKNNAGEYYDSEDIIIVISVLGWFSLFDSKRENVSELSGDITWSENVSELSCDITWRMKASKNE